MPLLNRPLSDAELVKFKVNRLVLNPRRRRKLQKRGELIRWSEELNGWLWINKKGPFFTRIDPTLGTFLNDLNIKE